MTTVPAPRFRASPAVALGMDGVAVVAIPAGLFGAAFSMAAVFLFGAVAELAGVIGWLRRQRWGFLVLALGAGLMLGAAAYIVLGLIQPDGVASGGGYGGPPAP
jgi:hypothetical protein